MSSTTYRPDIDGLRALAVIGVILFHFGLGFPGGYVGVDVFFVISGYLITQIITRETKEHRFTLSGFWMRRIRRILPASCLVVITSLLIGYVLLNAKSLATLGKSALAQSLMMSNVYFWRQSDYFSESSALKPLLHTWSLAVDEQFYLFFPIALTLLLRLRRRSLVAVLSVTALFSFVLGAFAVSRYPAACFYLLPTRAWELLVGGIVALTIDHIRLTRGASNTLSILAVAFLSASMFLFTENTPFPGIYAIFPVIGSALFILSNGIRPTFMGRLLSNKVIVFVGLMSYSLYLWHWPILVFCRHVFVDVKITQKVVALAFTVILSHLSWKHVEKPFRVANGLRKKSAAFGFAATVTLTVGLFGTFLWRHEGFPSESDAKSTAIVSDITWNGSEYMRDSADPIPLGYEKTNRQSNSQTDFILWGDSHGMAMASLLDNLADEQKLKGVAMLSSGRPPVPGLWKPAKGASREKETTELNRERMDWIIQSGAKNVIMIARWDAMINGMLGTEIDVRKGEEVTFFDGNGHIRFLFNS